MKFSIIVIVRNAEKTLFRCVDALMKIDYPKDDFEIIIVNNASSDRTYRIATSYDLRIVGTLTEIEYAVAMELGAASALYEDLVYIDQNTIAEQDLLKKLKEIDNSPVISGEQNVDKYRSNHDTFLYLIRSKLYNPYYPQKNFARELWINKKNFKKVNKAKNILYIKKELLKTLYNDGFGFNNGNDNLFKKIAVDNKIKILSHTDIVCQTIVQMNIKAKHDIVSLGYKWGKRYLKNFNIMSFIYYSIHLLIITLVLLYPDIAIGVIIGLYLLFLIYLSQSKKDFWILFRVAPGEIIRFYSGTLKYLTSKE